MGFERPAMLWGALAALIPVIIHLVNRARAKPVRFAALEFLFVSDKRLARRLRLRQWLVLLLRMLLLAAIPFAFAKPYLTADEAQAVRSTSDPGAVVLIIDNSASMGALVDGETLLSRALDKARELVSAGGESTSFAVVTASAPPRVLGGSLTFDRGELEQYLSRVEVEPRPSAVGGALREAERVLAASAQQRRRVVVLTDNSAHLWEGLTQPWALQTIPAAEVIDVRQGAPLDNVAVTQVEVREATGSAGAVEAAVTVRNYGQSPTVATVTLTAFGIEQEASVSIPGRASSTHVFEQSPGDASASGAPLGTATVKAPGDVLAADDRWFFTLEAQGAATIAVVNGEPSTTALADELFFVRAALAADGATGAPRVRATILSPDDLTKTALEAYDAVVMANVGALDMAQRIAVEEYVKKGGGLLVTSGERLTVEAAASYGPLLPLGVRGIKAVVRPDDPAANFKALAVTKVDGEHPALEEFATLTNASLFRTRVYAYALLDNARPREAGKDDGEAKVLMALTGGIPVLVEASLGAGRMMMLATSIDRDWTDLPIRTSFVPLLQQMLMYLAGRLDSSGDSVVVVDTMVPVAQPVGSGAVRLTRPDGETRDLGEETVDEYTIARTDVPGHYMLTREGGKVPVSFAVNVDRRESDLAPQPMETVNALLETPGTADSGAVSADEATPAPPANRTKVWPIILALLFVLLAVEAWVVLKEG